MATASIAIVIEIICGFAGYAIGRAKERAVLGAVLGVLLGVIGLIIIAVIPTRRPGSMLPPGPGFGGRASGYGGPGWGTPPGYGASPAVSPDPWSATADPPGYGGPGPIPVAPAPQAVPAQWAPDPTGRHEQRWWDGRGWTADVSDQGGRSQDPTGL